ncbi:transposase [Caproicibacter sp.]|uniref:transposase n=1 Tax=Caproicibacter sp. TaxID=2814884 RepID=UPI003989E3E7
MEDLVPKDHILRKIEKAIDFSFIYDLVKDRYSEDMGRPSIDPVVLFKIVFIQYLFGIRSMRRTIKEIEVNASYRWFLGYDWNEPIPHFKTFGKNYTRRFEGTDIFAKEKHGLRYTSLRGKAKVTMQALLTFACMNLKKLAIWKLRDPRFRPKSGFSILFLLKLILHSNISAKSGAWNFVPNAALSTI